jgi:hypothetical protein
MTEQMLVHLNFRPYKFLGIGLIYRRPLNDVQLFSDAAMIAPYVDLRLGKLLSTRVHYSSSENRKSIGGLVALRLLGLQVSAGVESIDMFSEQSSTRFFQFQGGLSLCFGYRKPKKA